MIRSTVLLAAVVAATTLVTSEGRIGRVMYTTSSAGDKATPVTEPPTEGEAEVDGGRRFCSHTHTYIHLCVSSNPCLARAGIATSLLYISLHSNVGWKHCCGWLLRELLQYNSCFEAECKTVLAHTYVRVSSLRRSVYPSRETVHVLHHLPYVCTASGDPSVPNFRCFHTTLYILFCVRFFCVPSSRPHPTLRTGPVCSNGVPGIESYKGACCVAECGQCGGIGCSTVAMDLGLGSAECCEGTILLANEPCGEAPCVVVGTSRNAVRAAEEVDSNLEVPVSAQLADR